MADQKQKDEKTKKEDKEREKEIIIAYRPLLIHFMVLPFISIWNNSRFTYSLNFKSNELYEETIETKCCYSVNYDDLWYDSDC